MNRPVILSTPRSEAVAGTPLGRRLRRISALERREEARAFLDTFHDAHGTGAAARRRRRAEVRRDLIRQGRYEHTPEELAFGARLAWRNHGRCIGRLFWESLEVVDARSVTDPQAIADSVHDHLATAQSDGRVRSLITVFPPAAGAAPTPWIESGQIVQYAGHVLPGGRILGDRQNVETTRIAHSLGWRPRAEPSRFDLLPWFLRDADDRRHRIDLPQGLVHEVPIAHPDRPALSELGLRWYAVPLVSGMVLTLGGIDYPCAPFNGFYMATEIASRNFADARRYDLLPEAGEALGIARTRDPYWRDTALTEMNRAVLHSYRAAGVTMLDHHTASDQFMTFHRREQAAGRAVAADWRWIVPPQSGSACEPFHLRMRNFHPVPNYYWDRGDGRRLMPWYGDRARSRPALWADRLARRWKLWKRMTW